MEQRKNSVDGKQLASAIAWMGFGLVGSAYILFFSLVTGSLSVMLSPSTLLNWFLPGILPTLFVAASVLLTRHLTLGKTMLIAGAVVLVECLFVFIYSMSIENDPVGQSWTIFLLLPPLFGFFASTSASLFSGVR